jgi:hypothetical protein
MMMDADVDGIIVAANAGGPLEKRMCRHTRWQRLGQLRLTITVCRLIKVKTARYYPDPFKDQLSHISKAGAYVSKAKERAGQDAGTNRGA